jgi:hypothetical protein
MDPIGALAALILAASALYRTISGRREALTAGLWTAAFAMGIGALVVPLDAALKSITGLDSLSQLAGYPSFVVSSYLIARMTYYVARIESGWPLVFTVTSITGMATVYFATELHATQIIALEHGASAASAGFAIFLAVGLLPTHISAIIGVLRMKHRDTSMVWLLAIYGGVGALYPIEITINHLGTRGLRWSLTSLYSLNWVIQLVSFGALSLAGVIGVYRAGHDESAPSVAAH